MRFTQPCCGASPCSHPASPLAPSRGIWKWTGNGAGNGLVVLVWGELGMQGPGLSQLLLAPDLAPVVTLVPCQGLAGGCRP